MKFTVKRRPVKVATGAIKPRRKSCREESLEQKRLVSWFKARYPHYKKLLIAIRNEGKRTAGGHIEAVAMGMQAGFPDLLLLVPRGTCIALTIEMKAKKGKPTPKQKEYNEFLPKNNIAAHFCYNMREAADIIIGYLETQIVI